MSNQRCRANLVAVSLDLGGDRAVAQRKYLKATRVGEHRAIPAHHPMQSAQPGDPLGAGLQHQVIGVGQDDLRAFGGDPIGGHGLDRPLGGAEDEGGRVDDAMRRRQPTRARPTRPIRIAGGPVQHLERKAGIVAHWRRTSEARARARVD